MRLILGSLWLAALSCAASAEPLRLPRAIQPAGPEWLMAMGDYANSRFSSLDQITAENAGRLQVAFTASMGVNRGQEATVIMVGGTLFTVSPYPNILYAFDLTKPGAPLKWRY